MTHSLPLADWITFDTISPIVERIGWTLLHSVWQFAAVAFVWMCGTRLLQRTSASTRYGMTLATLIVVAALPAITFVTIPTPSKVAVVDQPLNATTEQATGEPSANEVAILPTGVEPFVAANGDTENGSSGVPPVVPAPTSPAVHAESEADEQAAGVVARIDQWLLKTSNLVRPWLSTSVAVWLLGVVLFLVRPALACRTVYQLRRHGISPVGGELATRVDRLAERMGVRQAVSVVRSELVSVPAVVGLLRPMILLPASVLNEMTVRELEAIVAHELAHVRRCDYLVNGMQIALETIFFYHPAVWYVSHQLRLVREDCCDDLALAVVPGRAEYARSLVALEEIRAAAPEPALAASGGSLLGRVRRIVAGEATAKSHRITDGWQLLPFALSVLVFALLLLPQTTPSEAAAPKIQWRQITLLEAGGQKAAKGTMVNLAQVGFTAEAEKLPSLPVEDDGQVWLRDLDDGKHQLVARQTSRNVTPLSIEVPVPEGKIIHSLRPESPWVKASDHLRPEVEVSVLGEGLDQRISWNFDFTKAGEKAERYDITEYDLQLIGNSISVRVLPTGIPLENVSVDPGEKYSIGIRWIHLVQDGLWFSRNGEEISEPVIPVEQGQAAFYTTNGTALVLDDPHDMLRFVDLRRQATTKIEFEKKSFFLGENLLTHFGVTNHGTENLKIDVGGDYRGSPRHLRFVVAAFDAQGNRVADPTPNPMNMGGMAYSPSIAPGDTFWMSLPLQRYCDFREEGTYTIKIYHDLGWDDSLHWNYDFSRELPAEGNIAPVATAKIKLRMPSQRQARRVLAEALALPRETWTTGSGEKSKLYPEFEAMQYPVYVPLLKAAADEASDAARETDPERAKYHPPPPVAALGAIQSPEATRALIDLLAHEDSQFASAALKKLLLRIPYPYLGIVAQPNEHFETTIARVNASWREEFRQELIDYAVDVLRHGNAAQFNNNLSGAPRQNRIDAATLAQGVARREDYERLFQLHDEILATIANDEAESAYPQPQKLSSALSGALWSAATYGQQPSSNLAWARERIIVKNGEDLDRIDPFTFIRLVHDLKDFRPDGWETHVARLIDHPNVAVRAHLLFHLPKPLEPEWIEGIQRQLKESSPRHPLVFMCALTAVTRSPDPRFIAAINEGRQRNENEYLDHFIMQALNGCKAAGFKGGTMFGTGVNSAAGLTGTLKIEEPAEVPDPWFWPDPYSHLGHVDKGGDGWRYLRIAGDRKAAEENGIPADTQAKVAELYSEAQVASRGESNVAEIYQRYADQAEELLSAKQHARVWQLIYQRMSYHALVRDDVAERLDLSNKQRTAIDRAIADHLTRLTARDKEIQDQIARLQDLRGLVLQKQVDRLKKLTDARGDYGRASHKQVWTDVYEIFSAEQRALWNEMRGRMPESTRSVLPAFDGKLE